MISFLHGVEVTETNVGPTPVTVVNSAVIGIVGAAPVFAQPGIPNPWNPNGAYSVGNKVLDSAMNVQQCTVAGTTGNSAPTWGTALNALTTDGTVTWKLVQLANAAPNGVGSLNQPILVNGANDAANFGPAVQGYLLPYALAQIQALNAGQIIAVNVFNPFTDNTVVSNQSASMPASGPQYVNLGHMGVLNLVVQNSGKTITYVYGTDYTVDHENGIVWAKSGGAITTGEALNLSYSYASLTNVNDTAIIGAVTAGVYTGMQCWKLAMSLFGFAPKILIAPGFSQDQTTSNALDSIAALLGAMAITDSMPSTPVSTALSNRSLSSSAFSISSYRTILAFPNQLVEDTGLVPTGVTVNSLGTVQQATASGLVDLPYSPFVAGVMSNNDINNGYWYSPSNKTFTGPSGPDVNLYASFTDPASDTNNLNAQGIMTVFNQGSSGMRTWGNRSSAYPTNTVPQTF
ncbi:MAG: phage tail sheath subtilisin-like domain-containing protein, partial [Patescibacteria group bacterium]|nr:phage tail sheath subtilisin-like domain-containing protein [Patescibacteria group bacterium]